MFLLTLCVPLQLPDEYPEKKKVIVNNARAHIPFPFRLFSGSSSFLVWQSRAAADMHNCAFRERERESYFQNLFLTTQNDFGSFQDNQLANSALIGDKL